MVTPMRRQTTDSREYEEVSLERGGDIDTNGFLFFLSLLLSHIPEDTKQSFQKEEVTST